MTCPCSGRFTIANKSQHERSNRHQNFINNLKENPIEYEKVNQSSFDIADRVRSRCECGGLVSKYNKITHDLSKKHMDYHQNNKLNPIKLIW